MKISRFFLFFLSFCLVFFDQISKFLANKMGLVVMNEGISFGIFGEKMGSMSGSKGETFLIGGVIFLLMGVMLRMRKHKFAKTLFISGAISNLIDRLIWGGVRDWLLVPFLGLKNNLADWFIFVGLAVILGQVFRLKREKGLIE
jgi:lipoprotein signal peptidase